MSQVASTEKSTRDEKYRLEYEEGIFRKEYLVDLEQGEDGWIVAKCPELGVVTQGKTRKEIERNVIEAIELALEDSSNNNAFTFRIIDKSSV